MNLDLFDAVPEPEGEEESPPPVISDGMDGGEAPRPGPTIWTVSQVNQTLKTLLEEHLSTLWVSGEVANWKRARSGHCYFTLKDESAQLRCVMWKGDASRLPMDPEEGMRIRAQGKITLYEARGDLQLVARQIEGEEGEGLWRLAFERLKKKLDAEGLLDPARKKPLPSFPGSVGVVTSLTGAALHDILTVLRRRAPWLRVIVAGARVQGEGAAEEVAEAIKRLSDSGQVEVLIIGRGGGSVEDLWAFNEEPVARALATCPLPVISAVGHEVDLTISDLVADFRAPTPSAAAEAVAPDKEELLRYLQGARVRLARGLRRGVEGWGRALAHLRRVLSRSGRTLTARPRGDLRFHTEVLRRRAQGALAGGRRGLEDSHEGLARCIARILTSRRGDLRALTSTMNALSPLSTLERGYAVPMDQAGGVLRTIEDFHSGDILLLRVVNGRVRCQVLDTETTRSAAETHE